MSANSEPALFTKLGFDPAYLSTFEDKLFNRRAADGAPSDEFFHFALIIDRHRHPGFSPIQLRR